MDIELLDDRLAEPYDRFVKRSERTLFFASDLYRRLLRALVGCEDRYLLLRDGGEILGALPAFLCRNDRYGNVLNSLPFYGSNGGLLEFEGNIAVRRRLLEAISQLAAESGCVASTIVCSPFESMVGLYESAWPGALRDSRVGQITALSADDHGEPLMARFHVKTRNAIRKAAKCGVSVHVDNSAAALARLYELHRENMQHIGGAAKPRRFFELVGEMCRPDADYRVYVAMRDGRPVAGLLLFYFHKVVEYFTPAVELAERSCQPLSLCIFQAMGDAARAGYRFWNWGGTWSSQEGVYRFKSRWDAFDARYHYFTMLADEALRAVPRERLLAEYPYFYVYPFSEAARGHASVCRTADDAAA